MGSKDSLISTLNWAKTNGAYIDERIEFEVDEEKGISAKVNKLVNVDEDIIEVPKKLTIGHHMSSDILDGLQYESEESFSNNEITILVISKLKFGFTEQGMFFKSYLDMLPDIPPSPFFWESSDINLLRGTDADIKLERNLTKLLNEWRKVMQRILENHPILVNEQFTNDLMLYKDGFPSREKLHSYFRQKDTSWSSFRNYVWAYSILTSRGFPFLLVTEVSSPADLRKAILLPIFDLFNHENDAKVKWLGTKETQKEVISLRLGKRLNTGSDVNNNYGDKSNADLLLNYGFTIPDNEYDESTITIKLSDKQKIQEALDAGIDFYFDGDKVDDIHILQNGINFSITKKNLLPVNLLNLFALLTQLKFEKDFGITLRMRLESIDELKRVFESKLAMLRTAKEPKGKRNYTVKYIAIYRTSQKLLFQKSLEHLQAYEKNLLKTNKSFLTSFKTILKNDKTFMGLLFQNLGINSYDDLVQKNILNEVLLLWLIRVYNREEYHEDRFLDSKDFTPLLNLVSSQFRKARDSTEISKQDISDCEAIYNFFVPLVKMAPNVFAKGEWTREAFIISGVVQDRISYTRSISQEVFFVPPMEAGS